MQALRACAQCAGAEAALAQAFRSLAPLSGDLAQRCIGRGNILDARRTHLPARGRVATEAAAEAASWQTHAEKGIDVNPCGSPYHPAVQAGLIEASGPLRSLQDSYTPTSACFGCGPAAGRHALHLQTYRDEDGVIAELELEDEFCCFPGVISGGVISTLLDCQGNWAAAVRLMDESCLPGPPLTVTYSMNVTYREATAPHVPLIVRGKATNVRKSQRNRVTVEVDLSISERQRSGEENTLVTAAGVFKRLGALRAI